MLFSYYFLLKSYTRTPGRISGRLRLPLYFSPEEGNSQEYNASQNPAHGRGLMSCVLHKEDTQYVHCAENRQSLMWFYYFDVFGKAGLAGAASAAAGTAVAAAAAPALLLCPYHRTYHKRDSGKQHRQNRYSPNVFSYPAHGAASFPAPRCWLYAKPLVLCVILPRSQHCC